jgi:hypothetical protein
MIVETDPIHGWPLTGYRCRGCKNAEGNGLTMSKCPHYKCPIMRNVGSLPPTISTGLAADIVGISRVAMWRHCKKGHIDNVHPTPPFRIPKEEINKPPMDSYPWPAGNPNCK